MLKTSHRGTVDTKKAHIKLLEMKAATREVKSVLEQVKSRSDLAGDNLSLKVFLEEQSKMKQQRENRELWNPLHYGEFHCLAR